MILAKSVEFIEKHFVQKLWHFGLLRFMINSGCTKVTGMASFRLQWCIDLVILLIAPLFLAKL